MGGQESDQSRLTRQTAAYQEGNAVKQERCSYDLDFDSKKGVLRG